MTALSREEWREISLQRLARVMEANDDEAPPADAISLTDLVAMSGVDEDTLLQRLAGILNRRVEGQTDE